MRGPSGLTGTAVIAALVMAAACSEPQIVESGPGACSNKQDDDGDGLIDCDDPDCAASGVCERLLSTCLNGVDDDQSGLLDCQEEACRSLAPCRDPIEAPCSFTSPETRCPRGKGCYITADNRRWCALEGASLAGDPCGDTDPSDRSRGCAAGYLCVEGNRCEKACRSDADCTRNSICRALGPEVSVCTLSCLVFGGLSGTSTELGCRSNEECVALQRTGLFLERGGWAHQCVARDRAPVAGLLTDGQLCFEDASRAPSDRCAPGFLCVPEPLGDRCRATCRARPDGVPTATCVPGYLCYGVVPFSAQEQRFDEPDVVGICLP